MIPCCPFTPEPGDKEGWRQYTRCTAIVALVVLAIVGLIILSIKL